MYFSNLIQDSGTFERNGTFPLFIDTEEYAIEGTLCFSMADNRFELVYDEVNPETHNRVFTLGQYEGYKSSDIVTQKKGQVHLSYVDVAETEENPLIAVFCNQFRVASGTKGMFKILPVDKERMVVLMVYGAAEFLASDGSWVPMVRCSKTPKTPETESGYLTISAKYIYELGLIGVRNGKHFKATTLLKMNSFYIAFTENSSSEISLVRKEMTVLDGEKLDEAEKELEERIKVENEKLRLSKEESARRQKELDKARKEQEELKKNLKEAKELFSAQKSRKKALKEGELITGESATGRNNGAEMFLRMVQGR